MLYWSSLVSTLDCPLPPLVTGGVCLATRVRYRRSCGLDTWSVLLGYLFILSLGYAWRVFALVLFFLLYSDQIGGGFLVCYFSYLSLLSFVFWM